MQVGFIGFGKMGSRMVEKLLKEGHKIVVWNRSEAPLQEFKHKIAARLRKKLTVAKNIKELAEILIKPRTIWLMLPAGEATEAAIREVAKWIEKDDIVIDGGNAYYKDTQRRYEAFEKKGIRFLGIGVSGGIVAATSGYPMMVGGDKGAFNYLRPIFNSLAKPEGGYDYFGEGGAGHFVKMVHNGIEYGIMQSLGEGFDVLEHAPYEFNLAKVAKLWQRGTLVSGFMLDRTVEVLEDDPHLLNTKGVIAESGEARWTVEQAKLERVQTEIIERSLEFRRKSQKDKKIQNSFTAKLVAALRHAFGGHEVIKTKRKRGKE